MLQKTYITLLFLLAAGGSAFAQKTDKVNLVCSTWAIRS